MIKLNQDEFEILEKKYKSNWKFQIMIGIAGLIIGTLALFVPLDILGKARQSGVTGSLVNNNGIVNSFIFMVVFVGVIWVFMYIININDLRKDLKNQIKIIGQVKIKRIENLSPKIAESLEGNKDTILHFEKNRFGIKKFYFKKTASPEYLNAKEMIIERAKYSKHVFKTEIL
jgi:hypothetical protein